MTTARRVGSEQFVYEPNDKWHRVSEGTKLGEAVGVATDSEDRLYVFTRGGDQPVMIFEANGNFVRGWGGGQFVRPHGIYIGPDDSVYLTDDQFAGVLRLEDGTAA